MSAFYDYVRGRTDDVPPGHDVRGMKLYRYLVNLGVRQLLEAHYPEVREKLGEDAWLLLIAGFVRESGWDSHFLGDIADEFLVFLEEQAD